MVMADASSNFGSMMRRARERRGISLRQIAAATKISVGALEVGLDAEQTMQEFLGQFPHDSVTAGSPHVPQEDHVAIESDRKAAKTWVTLVAISVPIAALILYFTLRSGR